MVFLSVPVFAANETGGQTDLTFTYDPSSPTYTVTIPATLTLTVGDNLLPIEVSATANLGGKNVVVTFEETQEFTGSGRYATTLWENGTIGSDSVRYTLYDAAGQLAPYFFTSPELTEIGFTLAEFTGDGTKNIRMEINENYITVSGVPVTQNVPYTGYIVFGIALVA